CWFSQHSFSAPGWSAPRSPAAPPWRWYDEPVERRRGRADRHVLWRCADDARRAADHRGFGRIDRPDQPRPAGWREYSGAWLSRAADRERAPIEEHGLASMSLSAA